MIIGCLLAFLGGWPCAGQETAASSEVPDSVVTEAHSAKTDRGRSAANRQLFYVAGEATMLYNRPDSTRPVRRLGVRTPVHRTQCDGDWCVVETDDGREGWVHEQAISNVWIRASKEDRRVYLYRGPHLVKSFAADFGYNAFSDKQQRGSTVERDHWRTPEGTFYVVRRNPNSEFYKALVLNYPDAEDARRGYREGLITRAQRDAIIRADEQLTMPPMNTKLGGWVEIHGDGTGAATNWTRGCVAVTNDAMNTIWWWAQVGTPVLVE